MQTNLNCNCPKPHFGMAILFANNSAERILKSRVKSLKEAEKINDIFKKQAENKKIHINLFGDEESGKLRADVYSDLEDGSINEFYKSISENCFSGLFNSSPVKFIKKLAKVADKEEARIIKKEEILNKMNF